MNKKNLQQALKLIDSPELKKSWIKGEQFMLYIIQLEGAIVIEWKENQNYMVSLAETGSKAQIAALEIVQLTKENMENNSKRGESISLMVTLVGIISLGL